MARLQIYCSDLQRLCLLACKRHRLAGFWRTWNQPAGDDLSQGFDSLSGFGTGILSGALVGRRSEVAFVVDDDCHWPSLDEGFLLVGPGHRSVENQQQAIGGVGLGS